MRENEFREWLSRRTYQGTPLTAKGVNNRVRKAPRIERALPELGFPERDLDEVHSNGRWPDLVQAVSKVAADWHSNEAAARKMAPEAPDPTRQLSNLVNVARQYGHFVSGDDPNYDAEADELEGEEIDEAALEELKLRFLARFPDFEGGGGFPGQSSYHTEEDEYKRALIEKARPLIASQNRGLGDLGRSLLDLVLNDEINLVGDYRRKNHLRAVRDRSAAKFEEAVGALAASSDPPPKAVAQFVGAVWPLVLEGSEHSQPYADIRVLATLFQAIARPKAAIAVSYTRFHNLGVALLGRSLFGNNPLTAAEYEDVLSLSAELFTFMEEWGWRPRDLWDVQGFIWVTCKEKLELNAKSDADRIRRYALETYIIPARERGDTSVPIRCGDVHNALGMTNAHANVCQSLRGRKFQELAGVDVPSSAGPDNSSTTTFTYSLAPATTRMGDLGDGPFWFVGAAFGRTEDQFDRFIRQGTWEINEPSPTHRTQVLSMEPGQRIAIKATYVRKLNLPFDNRGRPVSVMSIKAVGTITHNPGNGTSVSVDWQAEDRPREWYFYTYQPTIWEVYPDKEMARRLIAFAFEGADQDYDWFMANLSRWREIAAVEAEDDGQLDLRKRDPRNLILYGPPGTGKTWSTVAEAVRLCLGLDASDPLLTEESRRGDLRAEYERLRGVGQIAFITFHQNYAYEETLLRGGNRRPSLKALVSSLRRGKASLCRWLGTPQRAMKNTSSLSMRSTEPTYQRSSPSSLR
jgi:hypothetical protein